MTDAATHPLKAITLNHIQPVAFDPDFDDQVSFYCILFILFASCVLWIMI